MNWSIFQEQVLPIQNKLYRYALRITGNLHEAEDVVQEVFEKIWKAAPDQNEQVQNWEAWCMTLTKNKSLDKNRTRDYRRTSTLDGVAEYQTDLKTPAQSTEQNDMIDQIRHCIQALPEKQKLVIHLRDIEEMSYEEIAANLDISLDQVKVNLHRARKTVREKMNAFA